MTETIPDKCVNCTELFQLFIAVYSTLPAREFPSSTAKLIKLLVSDLYVQFPEILKIE